MRRSLVTAPAVLAGGVVTLAALLLSPAPARAQRGALDGHASIGVDHLPNVEDTTELRARLFVERGWTLGPWRIRGAVLGEGLTADRDRTRHDGHLQVREATVAWSGGAFDVRAGIGTIVWGRLDEVQPTDVVNPLDASKYLLEGRADARLPVAHARVRWFAGEQATVEGVWVPLFTRGRYDVLDEASSPFNLLADAGRCQPSPACPPVAQFIRHEPERSLRTSQGGARLSATTGRVDWALAVYSGFPGFGRISAGPIGLPPGTPPDFIPPVLVFENYPRFTIIGGDAETVRGQWAIRGEMAVTTGDTVVTGVSPLGGRGPQRPGRDRGRSQGGHDSPERDGPARAARRATRDAGPGPPGRHRHQRQPRRRRRPRLREGHPQGSRLRRLERRRQLRLRADHRHVEPARQPVARRLNRVVLRRRATTPSPGSPSATSSRCR